MAEPKQSCGECDLCCRLVAVTALAKPPCQMCVHAEPGRQPGACTIYDARPDECRTFRCAWLISNEDADKKPLPSELRPDRAHVVFGALIADGEAYDNGTVAHVDPDFPDAWREEPVLSFIDRLMGVGVAVVVCCDSKFAILKRSTAE